MPSSFKGLLPSAYSHWGFWNNFTSWSSTVLQWPSQPNHAMCFYYWGHTSASSLTLWPLRRAGVGITCERFFTLKQLQFHFYSSHYAGSGQITSAALLWLQDCALIPLPACPLFSNRKSSSFSRVSTIHPKPCVCGGTYHHSVWQKTCYQGPGGWQPWG